MNQYDTDQRKTAKRNSKRAAVLLALVAVSFYVAFIVVTALSK